MTRDDIEGLVGAWLPRLGLAHWKVTADWDTPLDDALADANTTIDTPYDVARIVFHPRFDTWTPDHAGLVVVHELLHLATRDLEESARFVREALPKGVRTLAEGWHQHELEGLIDRVAASLVAIAAGPVTPGGSACS